ncbi:MAG: MotA/TolQ/ExbB proton channel family protein [Cellvibrionaceae bacterium]
MLDFSLLFQQLGLLKIPFVLCSIIACAVIVERFLILQRYTFTKKLGKQGVSLLHDYQGYKKDIRSELASLWLAQQKKKLASGLRLLNIVVLVAPLLGLLGTVLGLMDSFVSISQQEGPVEVSVLADGLGLAMNTTAVGLLIAIPALVVVHLYRIWIDRLLEQAELQMNTIHFSFSDIDITRAAI